MDHKADSNVNTHRLPPQGVREQRFEGISVSGRLHVEKHYSVSELASLWSLSERTVRRMFENEPGVLRWGHSEGRHKRRYKTLRIPETVMLRVHRQLRIAG
jgi:transcriptional regulator GlxA family with amidase domain